MPHITLTGWEKLGEELVCQLCTGCGKPELVVETEWRDTSGRYANEKLKRCPICDDCLVKRSGG